MIYIKRLFIFFLLSVISLTGANHTIAAEKPNSVISKEKYALVDKNAITVVSYEQSSKDKQATLLIKNNTEENLTSLGIKIMYLDMSGNALGCLFFDQTISIKPGKTQKMYVDAFGHKKGYHYYKSEGDAESAAFKVNFEITNYHSELSGWHFINPESLEDADKYVGHCGLPAPILYFLLFAFLALICLIVGLIYIINKVTTRKTK